MTNPRDRFDYIVVGAGSAGCILAARLAADGETRVLLIEAGGSDRHWTVQMPGGVRSHYRPGSRFNWHFSSVPQRHLDGREIYQPRGRGLGGSSSINGMVYLRGHPLDYQRWVLEGAAGWSYAEVLPYFKRLERFEPGADTYRGGDGPVGVRRQIDLDPLSAAFLEAGRQAGFPVTDDVNGHRQEGFCRFDMNVDGGVRASTAQAYLHNAPRCANPTIRTGVLVQRVIVDGPRAVGVEFGRQDRVETAHAEREVIVAAGAFGSPQLLMLSGVGPADHLRAHGIDVHTDLPGVGGNLHDHLEVHVHTGAANRYRSTAICAWTASCALASNGSCSNRASPRATSQTPAPSCAATTASTTPMSSFTSSPLSSVATGSCAPTNRAIG